MECFPGCMFPTSPLDTHPTARQPRLHLAHQFSQMRGSLGIVFQFFITKTKNCFSVMYFYYYYSFNLVFLFAFFILFPFLASFFCLYLVSLSCFFSFAFFPFFLVFFLFVLRPFVRNSSPFACSQLHPYRERSFTCQKLGSQTRVPKFTPLHAPLGAEATPPFGMPILPHQRPSQRPPKEKGKEAEPASN